jgi:hypothetical protein
MLLKYKSKAHLYDILHKGSLWVLGGLTLAITGQLGYSLYLYKTEAVPRLIASYRSKVESEIALKQQEAEEERKKH